MATINFRFFLGEKFDFFRKKLVNKITYKDAKMY